MNGDGYYFVKLTKKTESGVNFVSIRVPFTEFNKRFESLFTDGKVSEYITLTDPSVVENPIDTPTD
jgi:hypothetical protein